MNWNNTASRYGSLSSCTRWRRCIAATLSAAAIMHMLPERK